MFSSGALRYPGQLGKTRKTEQTREKTGPERGDKAEGAPY